MTTEGDKPRDYSQFSPAELKQELISLFQILPSGYPVLDNRSTHSPDEGNYGVVLTRRFRSVLFYSFLTPATQKLAGDEFYFPAVIGGTRDYHRENAYKHLDLDSGHLGIFDEDESREIARNLINSTLKGQLRANEWAERDLGTTREHNQKFLSTVVQARHEFIEKYQEEP